jgi:hypothetical protein
MARVLQFFGVIGKVAPYDPEKEVLMKTHNLVFATLLVAAGSSLAALAQNYPPPGYPPPGYQTPPPPPPSDAGTYDPQAAPAPQGYDNQGGNPGYDDQQQPYYDPRPDGNYGDPGTDQAPAPAYDSQGPVDQSVFYDQLSPYGHWIQRDNYGWVWEPNQVPVGWRPYTQGHWVDSDYGWTWVSDEPWGWATYHYGRWTLDSEYGWLWVPGSEWGPAWVSFQEGDGYVGWAPLPPAVGFRAGIGLELGGINLSVAIDPYAYSFVSERSFLDARLEILPPARNVTFIHTTRNITNITVVNNRIVNRGIEEARIAQATGRPVHHYQIAEVRNPRQRITQVQGDRISIFRPAVTLAKPRPNVTPMAIAQQRQQRIRQAQQGRPGQPTVDPIRPGQPGQQAQVRQQAVRPTFTPADLPRKHQAEQQQLQARQDAERNRLTQMQEAEKSSRQNDQARSANLAAQHQAEQQALQQQQQREQQMLQGRHQREQQAVQSRPQPQQQRQPPTQREPKREPQHDQKPPV